MKKIYTKEYILSQVKQVMQVEGRDIVRTDFGKNNLPSVKTIERKFGGLSFLRKELNLVEDHRTGDIRSLKATELNQRAINYNANVCLDLLSFLPEINVHKESTITDDRRNRTDFKIFSKDCIFFVDLFFPSTMQSFYGCISSKLSKYKNLKNIQYKKYKIIFVNMNNDLSHVNLKRKSTLPREVSTMDYNEFIDFMKGYPIY